MSDLVDLHRAATRKGGSYEQRKARWEALHEAVRAMTARLPFRWHSVAMDNPTQNHTGGTNGRNHIVLDEDFARGRLTRSAGQALCGGDTANLWCEASSVTCKRCLTLAERIATHQTRTT